MFEREVMIGTLKRQKDVLDNLIQEMEAKPNTDWQETQYYHETLKKIESSLKRIRRVDEEEAINSGFGSKMKYFAYPMRMRDIS